MTNRAILHAASRVIRRLTTDEPPPMQADETAVDVAVDFDLGGGPWKLDLDNVTKLVPTSDDLDQAYTQPARPELALLLLALDDAIANGALQPRVAVVFQRLRALLTPKRSL
jgi:hypothetical protein